MARSCTESALTRRLRLEVERRGGELVTISGGRYSQGYPDRVLVHRDWTGLLEIKTATGRLSALQRAVIRRLRSRDPRHVFVLRILPRPSANIALQLEDEDGRAIGPLCESVHELLWVLSDA